MMNLAADPAFAAKAAAMREKLLAELKKQNDPRVLGNGDVFDNYLSPRTKSAEAAQEKRSAPKNNRSAMRQLFPQLLLVAA